MTGWFDEGVEEESPDSGSDEAHARSSQRRDDGASDDENPAPGPDDRFERYRVKGDDLLSRVKELVREGNIRKITIRNDEDRVLLSFPLAAGVLGAALLPMWAAIGAVAALVGNCSIEVERRE